MASTDPVVSGFTPPSRVKTLTSIIVGWVILTYMLSVHVPKFRTIYEGFEFLPAFIPRQYIWFCKAADLPGNHVASIVRLIMGGISLHALSMELFIIPWTKGTSQPRLTRVAIWLWISMPIVVTLAGVAAFFLDLYINLHFRRTLTG